MQASTLWEPWAMLVALEEKKVETRGWWTSHRGLLAIHAAKRWDVATFATCREEPFLSVLAKHGHDAKSFSLGHGTRKRPSVPTTLPLGAVVCIVDLIDCVKMQTEGPLLSNNQSVSIGKYTDMLTAQELAFGIYAPGRYAHIMRLVERFKNPIPASGHHMRYWEWSRP
jgi:hypothetical protein